MEDDREQMFLRGAETFGCGLAAVFDLRNGQVGVAVGRGPAVTLAREETAGMNVVVASSIEPRATAVRLLRDRLREQRGQPALPTEGMFPIVDQPHRRFCFGRGRLCFVIAFSDLERAPLRERVASHRVGVFQSCADRVLAELPRKWIRWSDAYFLSWVAKIEDWLRGLRDERPASEPAPPRPVTRP